MKKLLALLLVLVMVVALVACGGNDNETEAPTDASQPASDATVRSSQNLAKPQNAGRKENERRTKKHPPRPVETDFRRVFCITFFGLPPRAVPERISAIFR